MSRKILVQMPSYVYLDLPANVLQALINAPAYEYKYDQHEFFRDINARIELRVVDEDTINDTPFVETKLET